MSLAFIDDLGEKKVKNMCPECKLEITLTTLSMFHFISMGEFYVVTNCRADNSSNPKVYIGLLCSA